MRMPTMSAGFYTGDDYDSIPYVTPGDISNHITWGTSCFLLLFVAISFVSLAGFRRGNAWGTSICRRASCSKHVFDGHSI